MQVLSEYNDKMEATKVNNGHFIAEDETRVWIVSKFNELQKFH